jgi:hypothetical protein
MSVHPAKPEKDDTHSTTLLAITGGQPPTFLTVAHNLVEREIVSCVLRRIDLVRGVDCGVASTVLSGVAMSKSALQCVND